MSSVPNIFAGFDDYMEQQEPGYKARCAAEKRQREAERLLRRANLIEQHGEEAFTRPCERELRLQKSLARWITWCAPPHEHWVNLIDGECAPDFRKGVAPHIKAAMGDAIPWPTTVTAAAEESAYWHQRDQDIGDVWGGDSDCNLDRTGEFRRHVVDDLLLRTLPVETLADFQARFAKWAPIIGNDVALIHADFTRLVRRGAIVGAPSPSSNGGGA